MTSHGQLDQAKVGGFAEHFATQPLANVLAGHFPERLQRSAEFSKVWGVREHSSSYLYSKLRF